MEISFASKDEQIKQGDELEVMKNYTGMANLTFYDCSEKVIENYDFQSNDIKWYTIITSTSNGLDLNTIKKGTN